jgi:valyl-tRNA synthetase
LDSGKTIQTPLWNAYHFFTLYANAGNITAHEISNPTNVLDKYILAELNVLTDVVKNSLNEWEDPFDEVGLEDVPLWRAITVPYEELWDCSVYNQKNEYVGTLHDLHFIYSPKKNKCI